MYFHPEIEIKYIDSHKCHEFTCNAKNCKGKGKNPCLVCQFLDMKDKASNKTLHMHTINCWGQEIVDQSDDTDTIKTARQALKGAVLWTVP